MYFTREAQIAPEEIEASHNGGAATTATAEQANEYDPGMLSRVFSGAPGEPPANGATQLLQSPALSSRSNTGVRIIALSRAQQTHGNRYTQRLVSQIQLNSKRSRVIQRECACGSSCAKCSGTSMESVSASSVTPEEPQRLIQTQAAGSSTSSSRRDNAIIPEGDGQPMDEATRDSMESRFNTDFGNVRLHSDQAAATSAEALNANAYTSGRDIYFAAGKYAPAAKDGQHLLAHELTHVQQQAAGQGPSLGEATANGEILIGAPNDRLEQEAEKQADNVSQGEPTASVTPDSSGAIQRDGWKSLTDNPIANTVAAGAKKGTAFIISQIEKYAPGAIAFFRNIRDYFKNAIKKAIDGFFGGILSGIREKGLAATLAEMIGSFASGALQVVGGFIAGQCAVMGKLAEYLLDLQIRLGSGILEQVKKGFEAVRDTLDQLWTEYGAPALDWVKKKLKAIWKDVEETASKIWEWLKPLREGIAEVWNAVTDFLSESRRSYNDWMDGFTKAALDKWEEVKAEIKPYMGYVKTAAKIVGAVVLLLSPAGPFVVLGAVIYGIYVGVKYAWEKWGKGFDKSAREWWANEGLPSVQTQLKSFRSKVDALKLKVQAGLQQLYDIFMQVLEAVGVITFLAAVKSVYDSVTKKIQNFKEKLDQKIDEWSKKLQTLLTAADPYIQQLKEAFRQTLLISLFGPYAFLDDGVWNTMGRLTALIMRTPCLREIGGLLRLPGLFARLGKVRAGIKEGLEVIKNPDPLLEKLKKAIEPMIAKIEPEIRSRVSSMYSDREIWIAVSIMHYLAESLVELGQNWWPELKKMGGDLLWPWPTVAKDFMPMLEAFGDAISLVFDLEFSKATDKFLSGMKLFNGIAGALSGWFLLASVLIGAALGALGFAFGPAGVATVGAGAAAGLEFAEAVGMGLLAIAVATEAAVIAKADFDLKFLNPRIPDAEQREKEDQDDCKAIGGSLISLVTIGALFLLADIAARFAKFLYGLVEKVPIVKSVAELLKDAKKTVGDFSFKDKPTAPVDVPPEGGVRPRDITGEPKQGEPVKAGEPEKLSEDAAKKAEEKGIPREKLEAEVQELRQKAANPENVRRPAKKGFDAEMDAQGHTFDREPSRTWCRFTEEGCGLPLGEDLNAKVDAALKEKPAEPAPSEKAGEVVPQTVRANAQARVKVLEENYGPILKQDVDLKLKLEKLKADLADPATAGEAAKRIPPLEDELIESAIAELEKRHTTDPAKLDQLRKHLREHPEDLGKALDVDPADVHGPEERPEERPPEGTEPPPESDRMRRIRNGELVDVTGFTNPAGEQLRIDPNYRPPQDALGRTNAERCREGLTPILENGEGVVLHHSTQDFFSPLDEHSASFHQSVLNDPAFHPFTGDPAYLSWRGEVALYRGQIRTLGDLYDLIRARYWRARFR